MALHSHLDSHRLRRHTSGRRSLRDDHCLVGRQRREGYGRNGQKREEGDFEGREWHVGSAASLWGSRGLGGGLGGESGRVDVSALLILGWKWGTKVVAALVQFTMPGVSRCLLGFHLCGLWSTCWCSSCRRSLSREDYDDHGKAL